MIDPPNCEFCGSDNVFSEGMNTQSHRDIRCDTCGALTRQTTDMECRVIQYPCVDDTLSELIKELRRCKNCNYTDLA